MSGKYQKEDTYIHRNKSSNEDNDYKLYTSLEDNMSMFKKLFNNDDTIIYREFVNQHNNKIKCCIVYADGMTDSKIIYEAIIQPIVKNEFLTDRENILNNLYHEVIISNNVKKTTDIDAIIESIVNGDTVLIVDGAAEILAISTKGWESRAIEEPESEKAIRAPREGFTESLMVNLSLIRREIRTSDLKFKYRTLGVKSHTKVCICYIEGIANEKILQELNKRLDDINIDGILASGYIQELIQDHPLSPFETIGYTERPDIIAGKLFEGRIALFLDNSPFVLTMPHLFIEYFQSNEDYYEGFWAGSIARLLRIFGFILTITVPGLFVSLSAFHQEMIPTPMLLSILTARKGIPFPAVVEALGMIIVFEILREAGARMPTYIGQTLSIVGALVIGQAAVDARIVSAPMVIVIAFSSITSLMISRIRTAALILRVILLLLSSILGMYGLTFGIIGLLIHLFEMRSFGMPYMYYLDLVSFSSQELKDTYIRMPWWYMKTRPKFISAKNIIRKTSGGRRA